MTPENTGMLTPIRNLVKRCLTAFIEPARFIYRALPLSHRTRVTIRNFIKKYAPRAFGVFVEQPHAPANLLSSATPEPSLKISVSDIHFPLERHPVVSIIMPIHGGCEYTLRCLKSICGHIASVPYEVIVVDDGSPDHSADALQQVKGIRLLARPEHEGFIRACNLGAGEARGSYLCFLSNDVEVTDHYLDELVQTFDEIPGTGLVGSKLVYPDATLYEAGGIIWRNGGAQSLGRGQDATQPVYNYAREVDYCSRASMMIPKPLFESLGGFDEHYDSARCGELDLALKIRSMGYGAVYQPCSVVTYHGEASPDIESEQGVGTHQDSDAPKLHNRWKDMLGSHQIPDDAKDRNFALRALILGCPTPMPDQDVGSIILINTMYLLRSMGFQVTFIPSNFLHVPKYTASLQRSGVEALYHPYCASVKKHLKKCGTRYDAVFVSDVGIVEDHLADIQKYARQAKTILLIDKPQNVGVGNEIGTGDGSEEQRTAQEMKKRELDAIRAMDSTVVHGKPAYDELCRNIPEAKIYLGPFALQGISEQRSATAFEHDALDMETSWQAFKRILEDVGFSEIDRGHRSLKTWSERNYLDELCRNRATKKVLTATKLPQISSRGYMSNVEANSIVSHMNMLGEVIMHSVTNDPTIMERSKDHADALRPFIDKMSQELSGQRPVRILEIAAYAHVMGYDLQNSHNVEVVLTDICRYTLMLGKKVALENYSKDVVSRVHRLAIDYHNIPFEDGSFDIVFIAGAIHHTWDWRTVLNELTRVAGPGGVVVLYDEPTLREFSFYGFRTNRDYSYSEQEQILLDMGLLPTFADIFHGTHQESMFGSIENQTIPFGRLTSGLEKHGEIVDMGVGPIIGQFERDIIDMCKNGVGRARDEIERRLMEGIEKIAAVPENVYPTPPLPDREELASFAARFANRIHGLRYEGDDQKWQYDLAEVFGASMRTYMKKQGNLDVVKPGLNMDRFKHSHHDVLEAYPDALDKLLSQDVNIAPNVQSDSDDILYKFFPRDMWTIPSRPDDETRTIMPTKMNNYLLISDTDGFDKLGMLVRVHANHDGHPYRLVLLINNRPVRYLDVYGTILVLFSYVIDEPEDILSVGFRIIPVPHISYDGSSSPPDVGMIGVEGIFVLGMEDETSNEDALLPIISAENRHGYYDGLAREHSPELTEYPDDISQTVQYKNVDVDGFCIPCNSRVPFQLSTEFGTGKSKVDRIFHWAASMTCPLCKLNSEQRLLAALVKQYVRRHENDNLNVYAMGSPTLLHQWLWSELEGCNLIVGDYLSEQKANEVIHEDPQKIDMLKSETIDIVVGVDLLGLAESSRFDFAKILRVLKPGGSLLMVFPDLSSLKEDSAGSHPPNRATEHVEEASRHQHLVCAEHALARDDFAWNALDALRDAGFTDVCVQIYSSAGYGHIGTANTILSADKPQRADTPNRLDGPEYML